MGSIKTNLEQAVTFVLQDENDKVVAIIPAKTGEQDLSKAIVQAITDDKDDAWNVEIEDEININWENSSEIRFDAEIEDDENEKFTNTFYLVRTEIYE